MSPLFRIDDRARPTPSLVRFALGPISLVVAFALYAGGHVSQLAAMCIVGAGLLSFQAAQLASDSSRDAYDRAAVPFLAREDARGLGTRLEKAFAFRVFGSTGERAAREAAVLVLAGDREPAAKAWARAVAGYGSGVVPRSVALGFASAALEAGWDRDAARAYRALYDADPELPLVRARLALSLARLGEDADEARALLAIEEGRAGHDEAALRAVREALSGGARSSRGKTKGKKSKASGKR